MSAAADLLPMDTLFEVVLGAAMPLPERLAQVYGQLEFPPPGVRPYVIGCTSYSLAGVINVAALVQTVARIASGESAHSRFLMGLLRAVSDAVIVGAGALVAAPLHRWTPESAFPELGDEFHRLRTRMGRTGSPPTVLVTSRGGINLDLPVFQNPDSPVFILTTEEGVKLLERQERPDWVRIIPMKPSGILQAEEILDALARYCPGNRFLIEGGSRLLGSFFDSRCLDELFLVLSPQVNEMVAGRAQVDQAAGQALSLENTMMGSLYSVKRAESHLFLRYGFSSKDEA